MASQTTDAVLIEHDAPDDARLLAGAFIASFGSPHTRKAYRRDLETWFEFCGRHGLHPYEAVSRSHVEVYARANEQAGYANATRQRRLSTLASWMGWLIDEGYREDDPVARVRRPAKHTPPQPFLYRREMADWLDAAEDLGGYDYATACLLALHALRVSEVCGLDVGHVGGETWRPQLYLVGKGDKDETIDLCTRTADAIERALDGRQIGPLILNRGGRRTNRACVDRTVKRIARHAEIDKHVSPHALRRSAITALLDSGVPLRDVQRFARHASPETTLDYDMGERSAWRDPSWTLMAATAS